MISCRRPRALRARAADGPRPPRGAARRGEPRFGRSRGAAGDPRHAQCPRRRDRAAHHGRRAGARRAYHGHARGRPRQRGDPCAARHRAGPAALGADPVARRHRARQAGADRGAVKPKLLSTLPGYTRRQFAADAVAGVTVAMVALPLSIAIAIASGAAPAAGLVTAVVGGFLISSLGGSRVQIGGPTGAFIVVVYGVIARHGFDGLLLATLMAGIILLVAGLLRAGRLCALPVDSVGTRFGARLGGLPWPHLPPISPGAMLALLPSALVIAFLAGVESLLSAVVADRMVGGAHRSNAELLAQGAANIAAPLFGGLPATGAIARTATNVRAGGRTPIAGIVHALIILAVLLAEPLAGYLAMAALAGLLIVTAWTMSEPHRWPERLHAPRADQALLLLTMLLTVLADLPVAIAIGTACGFAQRYWRKRAKGPAAADWFIAVAATGDMAAVRDLFGAYAAGLSTDLAYQDFDAALAALPGKYAAPQGALLIARDAAGDPLGCVALRPLGDRVSEMKRLYVAPAARGTGLGGALMRAIIDEARRRGYGAIRLDTLADMAAAQAMYAAAGVRPIAPYYDGAAPGTIFLELTL